MPLCVLSSYSDPRVDDHIFYGPKSLQHIWIKVNTSASKEALNNTKGSTRVYYTMNPYTGHNVTLYASYPADQNNRNVIHQCACKNELLISVYMNFSIHVAPFHIYLVSFRG